MVERLYCRWLIKLAGTLVRGRIMYEVLFNWLSGTVVTTCISLGYWVKNFVSEGTFDSVVYLAG